MCYDQKVNTNRIEETEIKMPEITCIIPFLNEGEEVENTLKSIREHSKKEVEILLVDDNSYDGMDYLLIARRYNARYHRNHKNCGSTKSRDIGVNLCETPFFLMLDAHMRFNDDNWAETIVKELKMNNKQLLCCQTSGFKMENGYLVERPLSPTPYGAYIDLENVEQILNVNWLYTKPADNLIPCVLGASYATSTKFWKKIKGLEGLKGWGSEEAYISLKTWMFGGVCRLLPNIIVSHYYREQAPYTQVSANRIYNKMIIAETLLSENQKREIFSYLKFSTQQVFATAFLDFWEDRKTIDKLKTYYNANRIHGLSVPECLPKSNMNRSGNNVKKELEAIYQTLTEGIASCDEPGLYTGLMGIAIFLYHYMRLDKNSLAVADACMDRLIVNLDKISSLDLASGFAGIGWGIEYLVENEFCEGDTDDLLNEVDTLIENLNISDLIDISIASGLGGIVQYVICRMNSARKKRRKSPFSNSFIKTLYQKIAFFLQNPPIDSYESIDIFLRFNFFVERPSATMMMSIYDNFVPFYTKFDEVNCPLGLAYGLAGRGMNLLTNYFYSK